VNDKKQDLYDARQQAYEDAKVKIHECIEKDCYIKRILSQGLRDPSGGTGRIKEQRNCEVVSFPFSDVLQFFPSKGR